MPPIARLTPEQAMYHFLSGYTAKWRARKGRDGARGNVLDLLWRPLHAAPPAEYGRLLRDLIAEHKVDCWLVNTGWTGGAYGTGHRMPIKATRALLAGALNGELKTAQFRTDPHFGFAVPVAVEGVDARILDPRSTWADGQAYDAQARKLVAMFITNFAKFEEHVDGNVRDAAPTVSIAAE